MKQTFLTVLFFLSIIKLFGQKDFTDDNTNIYKFGVRIVTTYTGVGEYYIVHPTKDKLNIIQKLDYQNFIMQILGTEASVANEKNQNFFQYYKIKDPDVVAQIWRLRYALYPFACQDCDTMGWTYNMTNPFMPTPKQMIILQKYGIKNISDIIYGENLFLLLRDMEDKNWVTAFVNASKQ